MISLPVIIIKNQYCFQREMKKNIYLTFSSWSGKYPDIYTHKIVKFATNQVNRT